MKEVVCNECGYRFVDYTEDIWMHCIKCDSPDLTFVFHDDRKIKE